MKPDIKIYIRDGRGSATLAIGPGKIALLEAIKQTGSISSAAKSLGMSYRRAWLLVDETNRCLTKPAVHATAGGKSGGGAGLTPIGAELIKRYRTLERNTAGAVSRRLNALLASVPAR